MRSNRSPIYGILSNPSMMDFPGRMAAVMFTTGCNFRCGFCHNASLLGKRQEGYTWDELDTICRRFKKEWVKGIVISGGEPTLWDGLGETLDFFSTRGFEVKLDTNGSRPEVLEGILPRLTYVAMDIKCRLARYQEFVDYGDTAAVKRSIGLIMDNVPEYEFRTTVIEGVHDAEEIRSIGETIKGAQRYVLQAFIPRENLPDKALRTHPRTRPNILRELADIAGEYVDNVVVRGD